MTQLIKPSIVETDLAQRLRAAGEILLTDPAPLADDRPAHDAGVVLDRLVRAVQADLSADRVWLLYVAVTGTFPEAESVMTGLRFFQLTQPVDAIFWLLDQAVATNGGTARSGRLRVVSDRVVVDVDHSARHDLHTGIQQVVRRTLPIWQRERPMLAGRLDRRANGLADTSPAPNSKGSCGEAWMPPKGRPT